MQMQNTMLQSGFAYRARAALMHFAIACLLNALTILYLPIHYGHVMFASMLNAAGGSSWAAN